MQMIEALSIVYSVDITNRSLIFSTPGGVPATGMGSTLSSTRCW